MNLYGTLAQYSFHFSPYFWAQRRSWRKPRSIKVCTLLNKAERRTVDVVVDYVGFKIPNKYVVGYGLDYQQKYRNLPYLAVLDMEGVQEE